jgi:protein required for attachment to host cells
MIRHGRTLVVVADGCEARCLEWKRDGALAEIPGWPLYHNEHDAPHVRDRPARVHESLGARRSAVVKRFPPREEEERRFLKRVAENLDGAVEKHAFEEIVIFAPPRALGHLRAELSETLRKRVRADRPVDLIDQTEAVIAEHLKSA